MKVKLIAAQSLNGVIGSRGRIPWRLPTDMAFFRKMTEGHTVVMGRKTYESIGKPLKNRRNIVLSRTVNSFGDGVEAYGSIGEIERALSGDGPLAREVYIIGGEALYEAFMPQAEAVYLTIVEAVVSGDAYFPRLEGDWDVTLLEAHEVSSPAVADRGDGEAPWYPHRIYEIRRRSAQ